MNALRINEVVKNYSGHLANDNISFEVEAGKLFGLLGPNGAGKTTLIRIITQIIGPDSGTISFDDKPLQQEDQQRVGYLPEERGLYKKMKVFEQLLYLSRLKGLSKKEATEKILVWLEKFELMDWKSKNVQDLSKGMQQKVQFISTIIHDPELIILDEPFSGLDPVNTELIKNEIIHLSELGKTIIFSTHRMEQVEELCQRIVMIDKGKKVLEGNIGEIKDQFKKGVFKLKVENQLQLELTGSYSILEKNEKDAMIQIEDGGSRKELLRQLLDKDLEIVEFKEVLPSLNQIFIEQVGQ